MSLNGSNYDDFYKLCENQGSTLILIKTTKNKIFGGFTPLNWKKCNNKIYDKSNQTFIFSLNLLKKFDMIDKNKYAILFSDSYGPQFGDLDFALKRDIKEGLTFANPFCNFLSDNNLELTGGKGDNEQFVTEELEIYKVIFSC